MSTVIEEHQQLHVDSSLISSSESVDSPNGIKDDEKLVADEEAPTDEKLVVDSSHKVLDDDPGKSSPDVVDVGSHSGGPNESEGPSIGQIKNYLDSDCQKLGSVASSAKQKQVSSCGDAASNGNTGRSSDHVSSSDVASQVNLDRILIDTRAPFESVKEAVSKFGGIVDWKAHKVQTVERGKLVEKELEKVQQEIPAYKEKSEIAEQSKLQVLKDLESAKRHIEELKLSLERAQTEEQQAKQDSELAQLRVEEIEQGIAQEASVAAKAQLELAKARYSTAIIDLKSVKDELELLRKEYASLEAEKNTAVKKAEEAVAASKEVEKTVEELTIELISTKEALESAHAAHMEAEEQRIGLVMAKEQDTLSWNKELKLAEEELDKLNQQIESAKDMQSELNTSSSLLANLKAELTAYMESKFSQENGTHGEMQVVVDAANKELDEVKHQIDKATEEVNFLKVAVISLKSELEKERLELSNLQQREGMALIVIASLESELERIKSQIAEVQTSEKQAREKLDELPKKLQQASQEADEAKSTAELAREELKRFKEEAEQATAGSNTMETRLLAARKEIEAARASERLALDAIKALRESESTKTINDDSPSMVVLSLEEYYELSKHAHEAEEQANIKVAAALSQINVAKESESKSLLKLEEVTREVEERKEALRIAMEKAEKAKAGKLGIEQELRKWRSELERRRKAGESSQGAFNSPRKSTEEGQGLKGLDPVIGQGLKINRVVDPSVSPPVQYKQAPGLKSFEQIANPSDATPQYMSQTNLGKSNTLRKKRKSLFPRLFLFFARRKPASKTT